MRGPSSLYLPIMEMLKKICLADTISAVIPAIRNEPSGSMGTLTNCAVPLKIRMLDRTDQNGPYPCFCMRIPYPVPRTTKVTMMGRDVRNAADTSFLSMDIAACISLFMKLSLPFLYACQYNSFSFSGRGSCPLRYSARPVRIYFSQVSRCGADDRKNRFSEQAEDLRHIVPDFRNRDIFDQDLHSASANHAIVFGNISSQINIDNFILSGTDHFEGSLDG